MYKITKTHIDPEGNETVKIKRFLTRSAQLRAFTNGVNKSMADPEPGSTSQLIVDDVVIYDSEATNA